MIVTLDESWLRLVSLAIVAAGKHDRCHPDDVEPWQVLRNALEIRELRVQDSNVETAVAEAIGVESSLAEAERRMERLVATLGGIARAANGNDRCPSCGRGRGEAAPWCKDVLWHRGPLDR